MEPETAPVGGAEAIPATFAPAIDKPMNYMDAAQAVAKQREQALKAEPAKPAEGTPEPPQKLAEDANAAPPQEATGETQEVDPAPEPPLDLPRSWTKDQTEHWTKLDRATQEFLLEHDRKASAEVRRSQNEASDKLKGVSAKEQQLEQLRQQYEAAVPKLAEAIRATHLGEFADIQTTQDEMRLATEDWPRYARFQASKSHMQAVENEVRASTERQAAKFQTEWQEHISKENDLLTEKVPELGDKKKAAELRDKAVPLLNDVGFSNQQLADLASGRSSISVHDHRFQQLVIDAVKYREARAGAAKPSPRPIPPVQKPGAGPQKGAAQAAQIEAAKEKLSTAKGSAAMDAAYELLQAKRAARR